MTQSAAMPAAEPPQLPTSPQQLLARLDALGIAYENHQHAAVFTVEEAKALRGALTGGHIKNLFLRNKKEEMWLVVAEEDKRIDLKALGEKLGAGKLSFGSLDRLLRSLQQPERRLLHRRRHRSRQVRLQRLDLHLVRRRRRLRPASERARRLLRLQLHLVQYRLLHRLHLHRRDRHRLRSRRKRRAATRSARGTAPPGPHPR